MRKFFAVASARRVLLPLAVVLAGTLAGGAGAIINGEFDGNRHRSVGYIVFYNEANVALWRCSGALVSSRVVLTAAHCAGPAGPGAPTPVKAQIWFDASIKSGGAYAGGSCDGVKGWPCSGGDAIGTPVYHPQWDPANWLNDIGAVVFTRPIKGREPMRLAPVGTLDRLAQRPREKAFTIVGFGLQSPPDVQPRVERQRMRGTVASIGPDADPEFWNFTNDSATGAAACFGDSGGPVTGHDGAIVAVISGGYQEINECEGTAYHYRTDTPESQAFLARLGVRVGDGEWGRGGDRDDDDRPKKRGDRDRDRDWD